MQHGQTGLACTERNILECGIHPMQIFAIIKPLLHEWKHQFETWNMEDAAAGGGEGIQMCQLHIYAHTL